MANEDFLGLDWRSVGGEDPIDYENLPSFFSGLPLYARDPYADEGGFGDVGGTPSGGGVETEDQTYRTSPASGDVSFGRFIKDLMGAGGVQSLLGKGMDFATSKAGMAGLLALLSYLDRQKGTSYGGGTTQAYAGPSRQLTPTTVQGKYGPLVQYAANGGLMQAYANGGKVWPFPMQDNGFVMTAKAVKGAEKLAAGGITSLLPDATMVRGRGTGTSDEVPAYIQGENGRTPARLSNGEAYIPPGYDTDELYALMHQLERNA